MVVLMKKSATKEWLVITMERINAFVITTVLCAVDGVIMTGQIAGWFIYLNVLNPAIARKRDMTCLTAVRATEIPRPLTA